VKKEAERGDAGDWKLHIVPVHHYAVLLAEKTGADKEVVEVAAYLHDYGRLKFGPENHHETGAREAENILKKLGCDQAFISHVKNCILTHRSMAGETPASLEAKIISTADAMVHYDTIPWLLQVRLRENDGNLKEAVEWVLEKVERGWKNKILLPEAKEMTRAKYEAAKLLLESALKWLD